MEGILVPLGFFAMVAAIVIVPRYLKSLERQKLQETLRASIEKGAELPPEVVQALTSDVKAAPSPYRDLRAGIIWLGVAVGFAALGAAVSFEEPEYTAESDALRAASVAAAIATTRAGASTSMPRWDEVAPLL